MVESQHNSLQKFMIIGEHVFPLFRESTTSVGGIAYWTSHPVLDVSLQINFNNVAIMYLRELHRSSSKMLHLSLLCRMIMSSPNFK